MTRIRRLWLIYDAGDTPDEAQRLLGALDRRFPAVEVVDLEISPATVSAERVASSLRGDDVAVMLIGGHPEWLKSGREPADDDLKHAFIAALGSGAARVLPVVVTRSRDTALHVERVHGTPVIRLDTEEWDADVDHLFGEIKRALDREELAESDAAKPKLQEVPPPRTVTEQAASTGVRAVRGSTQARHGTNPPAAQDSPPAEGPPDAARPGPLGTPTPKQRLGGGRWPLVVVLLLICIAGIAAAAIALGSSSSSANKNVFSAAASPVPTNRVTGGGTVTVQLRGDVATVTVEAHGLVDQMHWMHIHAGGQLGCPTASAATVTNGHLYVSGPDGDKAYGPPVTSLTTSGDTSAQSHLAPTRYPVGGTIRYKRTITVPSYVAKYISEGDAFVVVHGIDYNHDGVYDNSLGGGGAQGRGEQGAPALCGNLDTTKTAAAQGKSSQGTVYTASMTPLSTLQAIAVLSLCHGSGGTTARLPAVAEPRIRSST